MATKINKALTEWIAGDVHSLRWLAKRGIQQNSAYKYFQSEVFEKLGPGIYSRKNEKIKWPAAVRLLQEELKKSIFVSGRTALELTGGTHYLPMGVKPVIFLTTYSKDKLPTWFMDIDWGCEFRFNTSALFPKNVNVEEFRDENGFVFLISSRELALLELINVLDLTHSFETVENYMNGLLTLRPKVLQSLLENCSSVKVKRVFLYLAEKLDLPYFKKIDIKKIDLGKGKRQVVIGNCQFDKKYQITVPRS